MTRLWGGRFQGAPDAAFDAFQRSLPFDRRLWREDLRGSAAWADGLVAAGVLTVAEGRRIQRALSTLERELGNDPSALDTSDAEDIHSFVEQALAAHVGDLARKLHTGRSRNDQVVTDLRLHLKGRAGDLDLALRDAQRALVVLAGQTADVAIPGHTHLQRAQPITAGHHALAYVEMLERDAGRLADAVLRLDQCPLGSGALAGTALDVDRDRIAKALGFAGGATRNSLDAVSDRDFVLELGFVCSLIMTHLSRFAEDWIFYASQEAGWLELGDDVSTGSSLMPQKKNPDALELVRGKSARVIGRLTGLLVLLKGLPLAYDKDLQEDKEAIFEILEQTHACLRMTTAAVKSARYRIERGAAECARGFLNATDLADLLVAKGVPFRDAHERVGRVVLAAERLGVEIEQLPDEVRLELLPELPGSLRRDLSVPAVLARRRAIGGTSPRRVLAEVRRWQRRLNPSTPARGRSGRSVSR